MGTYKRLTKTEEDIMLVVWKSNKGAISTGEVLETLQGTKRTDYARTTLVTILAKIKEKGYIETARKGKKAYIYPQVSYDDYRKTVMKQMVDTLFKGDVAEAQKFLSERIQ